MGVHYYIILNRSILGPKHVMRLSQFNIRILMYKHPCKNLVQEVYNSFFLSLVYTQGMFNICIYACPCMYVQHVIHFT